MTHLELISVPVADQQRSKQFYLKLGFEILAEEEMGAGKTWMQLGLPGSATSLVLVTWFKAMPAGSLQGLVIGTDNIEKDIKELQLKGVEITKIEETPFGKFVSLKDPDNNGLSLQQRYKTPA